MSLRFVRFAGAFIVLAGWLSSCATAPVKPPMPAQPKLVSVTIHGQQVCGNFNTDGYQYNFNCAPLPTIETTGWQLTPPDVPFGDGSGKEKPNRLVAFHIQTPRQTDLDIKFSPTNAATWTLKQVALSSASPQSISNHGEIAVARISDDGYSNEWAIKASIPLCRQETKLEVRNTSPSSPGSSNPLTLVFLRTPDESYCGAGGGGSATYFSGGSAAKNPPSSPPPSTPAHCTPSLMKICENCSINREPQLSVYSEGLFCSWADVLNVYGYTNGTGGGPTTRGQACTISATSSPDACEGQ